MPFGIRMENAVRGTFVLYVYVCSVHVAQQSKFRCLGNTFTINRNSINSDRNFGGQQTIMASK